MAANRRIHLECLAPEVKPVCRTPPPGVGVREWIPASVSMRRMVRPVGDIDVILFDAGGVLVLLDPTVPGPLLACYGGDSSLAAQTRAHYHAMARKGTAGAGETFWAEYHAAYVRCVGIAEDDAETAAHAMGKTFKRLSGRLISQRVDRLERSHELSELRRVEWRQQARHVELRQVHLGRVASQAFGCGGIDRRHAATPRRSQAARRRRWRGLPS